MKHDPPGKPSKKLVNKNAIKTNMVYPLIFCPKSIDLQGFWKILTTHLNFHLWLQYYLRSLLKFACWLSVLMTNQMTWLQFVTFSLIGSFWPLWVDANSWNLFIFIYFETFMTYICVVFCASAHKLHLR
jgi:hypothetical protein